MTTAKDRSGYLFTELMRHAQYGAVNKEHCIAAAEAGAWCLAEIERQAREIARLEEALAVWRKHSAEVGMRLNQQNGEDGK